MPGPIVENLPYYDHPTTVKAPDGSAPTIKSRQIVLWVSITVPGLSEIPAECPRFPAVLDPGFNDNFLLREDHLNNWAGLTVDALYPTGLLLEVHGQHLLLHDADVWVYPNLPDFRDQFRPAPPFQIQLNTGICVTPIAMGYPRLPLLGMLAMERAKFDVRIDSSRRRVGIQTVSPSP